MQGNYTYLDKTPVLITRPDLWESCKTEAEYFKTLTAEQKKEKPVPMPVFKIPDAEPGIIPGYL